MKQSPFASVVGYKPRQRSWADRQTTCWWSMGSRWFRAAVSFSVSGCWVSIQSLYLLLCLYKQVLLLHSRVAVRRRSQD